MRNSFTFLLLVGCFVASANAQIKVGIFPNENDQIADPYRLVWTTEPGAHYQVERSTDLITWEVADGYPVQADGPTQEAPFVIETQVAFFRVNRLDRLPPPTGFVHIPAGTFMMGSPKTELGRWSDETQHTVTISYDFYMSKYEVTQREYLAVMGNNPSYFKTKDLNGKPIDPDLNRPVDSVSWDDAMSYCAKLTKSEQAAGRLPAGWVYRLPTEAEWEYACRAGTSTVFHYGNDLRSGMANFDGRWEYVGGTGTVENPNGTYLARTTAVGSYTPNAFGLYDMHGNLWEWCLDWYGSYSGGRVTDPRGPSTGSYRVIRGGSWNFNAWYCRSAYRYDDYPGFKYHRFGFRPVLAPGQ